MEMYHELRNRYPAHISLDQLYRICRISKRSALYLIQHEIIPAIDTGKHTWRYQIAIDDVIAYLNLRDRVGSMIPPGAVTSRYKGKRPPYKSNRKSFAEIVPLGTEQDVADYFNYIYTDFEDVLAVGDVVEMTGLCKSTIVNLLKKGRIRSISDCPRYLIPKQCLMQFVVTRGFIESKTGSARFKKILEGYEIWKTAKSSR